MGKASEGGYSPENWALRNRFGKPRTNFGLGFLPNIAKKVPRRPRYWRPGAPGSPFPRVCLHVVSRLFGVHPSFGPARNVPVQVPRDICSVQWTHALPSNVCHANMECQHDTRRCIRHVGRTLVQGHDTGQIQLGHWDPWRACGDVMSTGLFALFSLNLSPFSQAPVSAKKRSPTCAGRRIAESLLEGIAS